MFGRNGTSGIGGMVTALTRAARVTVTLCALTMLGCASPVLDTAAGDGKASVSKKPHDGKEGAGQDAHTAGADADTAGTPGGPAGPATTDLFHREFGDPKGQPVIFLHGGPGANSSTFEETIAPVLAQRGFFAIAYDQRGSGRSPKGKMEDFTYAKVTQDLDDVIRTLGVKSPVFIAHSWGGTLAVKFMELHPGIAKGAVLVGNPVDYPDAIFNVNQRCAAVYESRFFSSDDLAATKQRQARLFPHGLTPPYRFAGEDLTESMKSAMDCGLYFPNLSNGFGFASTWARLLLTGDKDLLMGTEPMPAAGMQTNEHLMETDFSALFQQLRKNLYGIYGDEDGLFSAKQLAQIPTLIGRDHFTLVHGASHMVYIDQADEFMTTFVKYDAALRGQ